MANNPIHALFEFFYQYPTFVTTKFYYSLEFLWQISLLATSPALLFILFNSTIFADSLSSLLNFLLSSAKKSSANSNFISFTFMSSNIFYFPISANSSYMSIKNHYIYSLTNFSLNFIPMYNLHVIITLYISSTPISLGLETTSYLLLNTIIWSYRAVIYSTYYDIRSCNCFMV